jgi:hypothetical protein
LRRDGTGQALAWLLRERSLSNEAHHCQDHHRGDWTYEFDTVSSPGGTRLATNIAVCSVFVQ